MIGMNPTQDPVFKNFNFGSWRDGSMIKSTDTLAGPCFVYCCFEKVFICFEEVFYISYLSWNLLWRLDWL